MTPHIGSLLIVEGNNANRPLLEMLFKSEGYEVYAVAGCQDALACARMLRFDLCILSHRLSDGKVTELREKLRQLYPFMSALYYTGTVYSEEEIKCLRKTGDGYLAKPSDVNVLKGAVKALLLPRQV